MMLVYVVVIDACDEYCKLQIKLITMKEVLQSCEGMFGV
jgi:hypothetical protein